MLINFETDLYFYRNQYYRSYYFEVYINNKFCKDFYLYHNDSFKILSNEVKNYCNDENQFCLIRFLILSKNYKKASTISLKIEKINKTQSNFWKDNLKIIIIVSCSIVLFIIIIIIIVCICKKNKNKGDLLALKVNKVSFEEERINRNKVYQDGLLY